MPRLLNDSRRLATNQQVAHNELMLLYSNKSTGEKPKHYGPVTIKVWRAGGQVESVTCRGYSWAFDVLDRGAPVLRWEIHGEDLAPMRGADESWFAFGSRLAELDLENELLNYQWLKWGDWEQLVAGFRSGDDEPLYDGKPYPHYDKAGNDE